MLISLLIPVVVIVIVVATRIIQATPATEAVQIEGHLFQPGLWDSKDAKAGTWCAHYDQDERGLCLYSPEQHSPEHLYDWATEGV